MDDVLLLFRCLLALVFVVAAAGKALDLAGSRQAVADFGIPERWARPLGTVLPAGELAVAALLVVRSTAVAGAVLAAALLAVFLAAITRVLRQGQAPDCHCFGQLSSEPAGPRTLMRNAVLAVAAVLVAVLGPGRSLAEVPLEGLALMACAFALLGVGLVALRQRRELMVLRARRGFSAQEPERGLPRGTPIPELWVRSLDGADVDLASVARSGRPGVLVQVGLGCEPCHELLPELVAWRSALADDLEITVVGGGPLEDYVELAGRVGLDELLVAPGAEIMEACNIPATPAAIPVTPAGRVAGPAVFGAAAIEGLIRTSLRPSALAGA